MRIRFQRTKYLFSSLFLLFQFISFGQSKDLLYAKADSIEQALQALFAKREFQSAYPLFEEKIKIYQQLKDYKNLSGAYNDIAELYNLDNNTEKAIRYCKLSIANMNKSKVYTFLPTNYNRIASAYKRENQVDTAFYYYEKSIAVLQKSPNDRAMRNALSGKGDLYGMMGQLDSSIHYVIKSIDYIHGLAHLEAGAYQSIASDFSDLGNHEKSLEYCERIFNVINPTEYPITYSKGLLQKATSLLSLDSLAQAEETVLQSIPIFKESKREKYLIKTKILLSNIYLKQGKIKKARQMLEKVSYSKDTEDTAYLMDYSLMQFELNLEENNLSIISSIIKRLNPMINRSFYLIKKERFYKLLTIYYERINNTELSLLNLKKYQLVKDSLFNNRRAQIVHNLEAKYENEQKETEITQLKLEDDLNQTRLSRQRGIIGFITAGLIVFGGLFWRIRKQNEQIKIQNDTISKSLQEKNILLKEIHHRVKNNLQVISSLLGIQSRKIKDQTALDAIQEGRTRVHSMSLIHQNLYKENNLTGIELQKYLEQLCQSLFNTYNVNVEQIDLEMEIDPLFLDVDTVVPLGLILNELITNSLKYAFPDNQKGLIHIQLKEKENGLFLGVSDNGIGVEDTSRLLENDTFGYDLIDAFKHKMKAELNIDGSNGMKVEMLIKKYKKVA